MSDIESAIVDLVKELINDEVEVPSDEDIDQRAESAAESYLNNHLEEQVAEIVSSNSSIRESVKGLVADVLEVREDASMREIIKLKGELLREMEIRSLGYKFIAMEQKIKARLGWFCLRRRGNARRVHACNLIL